MVVDKLDLGFATVTVTVNKKTVSFKVNDRPHYSYCPNGRPELHPAGYRNILIDVLPYQVGDIITAEYSRGDLQCDGGGERKDNVVGEIDGFTVAMGAPATYEYEDGFDSSSPAWPADMRRTSRALPYESLGFTPRGFRFEIKDNPRLYNDRSYRKCIEINLAWEHSDKDYAWDIVSYLTS